MRYKITVNKLLI